MRPICRPAERQALSQLPTVSDPCLAGAGTPAAINSTGDLRRIVFVIQDSRLKVTLIVAGDGKAERPVPALGARNRDRERWRDGSSRDSLRRALALYLNALHLDLRTVTVRDVAE